MKDCVRSALLAALAAAAAWGAAPDWVRVRSPHFEILTSAGGKRGREAAVYFEQVRAFLLEVNRWKDNGAPVRIVAFENDRQYEPFRANDFSSAYYVNSGGQDWIAMRSLGSQAFPTAVHEYSHVALRRAGLVIPPWLNEGLAELHSTLRVVGDRAEIGHYIPERAQVLRENRWIGLGALTDAGYDSPLYREKAQAEVFYAESWLLTHMLALSDGYRNGFRSFLQALRNGSGAAAFEQAYGKTLVQVQKDLAAYFRANAFPTAVFPLKLEKPALAPEVRPATGIESGMTLAGLLSALGRFDPARERYGELSRMYPQEPAIEEALTELERRAGRRREAIGHCTRAAALGSRDADLHFDCAMWLGEAGAADAEISRFLERAVELRPDSDEARYFLGMSLLNQGRYKEGLDNLLRVRRVSRERASTFARAKARANYELENLDQAKQYAAEAVAAAQTEDDRTKSQRLMEFLNQPAPPGPEARTQRVSGSFAELECIGKAVRIWIRVGGKRESFDVPDLEKVRISGGVFDFACGPQDGRRIEIESEPDGAGRTVVAIALR